MVDLVLVNPGGRDRIYQQLGQTLTAIEPPLWCRLIGGYARDRGHSIAIIDSEAESIGPAAVAERVAALKPLLVAIVAFGHQPSASTQAMVGARLVADALRDNPSGAPSVIVGGHISALPERTLAEEPVDFACKGEGPVTVAAMLDALKSGADLNDPEVASAIDGLVWRDGGGKVVVNRSAALITDLDRDLHGDVWDLLPMNRYRAHNWQCFGDLESRQPYASIYTTLGCPYKCTFCCINAPFDTNRYRMRSAQSVVEEIDLLHEKYGVKTFKIIDEMFVLNERHVLGICDLLIERNYNLNIWSYARIDTVKPHFLEKLRKAGMRWLALGIESGSKHVRDGALKALKQDDIVETVREIQKAGIAVIGNFIFGLPDDTMETMRETLDLAKVLNCEFANFYSAMAYPGSPLYLQAVAKGLELPANWSGYSQHSVDCLPLSTDILSAAEVLRFRDGAFHEYFADRRYLDMVTQRFGWDTRRHIEEMASHKLDRTLLRPAVSDRERVAL